MTPRSVGDQSTTKTPRHQDSLVSWRLCGKSLFVAGVSLLVAGVLAGCSLSAPPPERGSAPLLTPAVAPSDTTAFELPTRRPSVANGAAIYAEKCSGCHGPAGRGDGEKAAQIQSTFGVAPADLTSDRVARASTAASWFGVVTSGKLDENGQPRGMPGFSGSLSVDDRWDVIVYAWSLSAPDNKLAAGRAIYADRCVQCHGETGKGDGPQASGKLRDLSDLSSYQDVAPGEWDNAVNATHVPSFAGKLSGDERAAVTDYIRSFAYDTGAAAVSAPASTSVATPAAGSNATPAPQAVDKITVNGSVANGTSGSPTPGNLDATLYYFAGGDSNTVPVTQSVKVDATGHFTVSDLDAKAGDIVAAAITYADVAYTSDTVTVTENAKTVDLPIRVYEPTTSTSAIHIDTLHIIAQPGAGAVQVIEVYFISNLGDRSVANTTGDPTLRFTLPAGATGFQGMSNTPGVYVQTVDGFEYRDAVPPGSRTVQAIVTYQLPVNGDVILDRAPTYPVNSVDMLVSAGDLKPSGDQFIDRGTQDFQGETYQVLAGGPFPANEKLAFRLAKPASVDVKLIAAVALLVVGGAGIGFGLWRMRSSRESEPAAARKPKPQAVKVAEVDREALLDQIAALDDAYEAGQIAEADYRKRREALKTKLLR